MQKKIVLDKIFLPIHAFLFARIPIITQRFSFEANPKCATIFHTLPVPRVQKYLKQLANYLLRR